MIQHVVLFTFKKGLESKAKDEFFQAFYNLASLVYCRAYNSYRVSEGQGYEHAVVLEFDGVSSLNDFNGSEEHSVFLQTHWSRAVESFAIYDLLPGRGEK